MNAIAYASEPLTTKEFFALDVDEKLKVELIGGALLVSPSTRPWHGYFANALGDVLRTTLGSGFLVFADLDVVLDDEVVPRPDLFVISRATYDPDQVTEGANVLLAVEIVSPGSKVHDRRVKPVLYRDAGIPSWRIERDGKRLYLVETPVRGEERTHVGTAVLTVADIEVTIDLDTMAREILGA